MIDGNLQLFRATQRGILSIWGRVGDKSRSLQTSRERLQCHHPFAPSQRGANAIVVAAAKAKMLIVLPLGPKTIGIDKASGVTAARGKQQDDPGSLRDSHTIDGYVGKGFARPKL